MKGWKEGKEGKGGGDDIVLEGDAIKGRRKGGSRKDV